MNKEHTKKCPFCAEQIKSDAIKCKHCKSDLSKIIARQERIKRIEKETKEEEDRRKKTNKKYIKIAPFIAVDKN